MNKAIVSCEVFYEELNEIIGNKDIDVELLSQGLHNLPQSEDMKMKIQEKIDLLEAEKNYKYIFLGYGNCSGGVEGLKADRATLVIPKVHDCIPLLLGELDSKIDRESRSTYYLSRGWIDCGGDSYKEYLFLTNNEGKLKKKFNEYEEKEKGALTNWYEKKEYRSQKTYPEESAKYICGECIKNYDSITVIDNDNLDNIHREYAQEMQNFLNDLLEDLYDKSMSLKEVQGNQQILKDLINFENLSEKQKEKFVVVSPGEKLRLELNPDFHSIV
ncbi:MAG: DUF1638 domain-containing protein [Bacillota bacterium]